MTQSVAVCVMRRSVWPISPFRYTQKKVLADNKNKGVFDNKNKKEPSDTQASRWLLLGLGERLKLCPSAIRWIEMQKGGGREVKEEEEERDVCILSPPSSWFSGFF
jgi:hypothetical protein